MVDYCLGEQHLCRLQCDVCAAAVHKRAFADLAQHALDCCPLEAHVPLLIQTVARKFAKARLGHLGKSTTAAVMGTAHSKRSQKSRLLIFQHV